MQLRASKNAVLLNDALCVAGYAVGNNWPFNYRDFYNFFFPRCLTCFLGFDVSGESLLRVYDRLNGSGREWNVNIGKDIALSF